MTLPPLPDLHPGAGYRAGEVREMLQAYGRQCAKDALLRVLALIPGGPWAQHQRKDGHWKSKDACMKSEIDELRATLAGRDAEIEKLKATFAALDEATMGKLCMQRAAMQQALDAMVVGYRHTKPRYNAAIAALKEALK